MARLEIYVSPGCSACAEARRLAAALAELPRLDVGVHELDPDRPAPEPVVAVPTYLLNGQVFALGNPEPRALLSRLAAAAFASAASRLLVLGVLAGSLALCVTLLALGGVCLTLETGQLFVNGTEARLLRPAGVVALIAAGVLALATWRRWSGWPVPDAHGLWVGWSHVHWDDVVDVREGSGNTTVLEVLARDGRRLRLWRLGLDPRGYADLRRWLEALAMAAAARPTSDVSTRC